MPHPKPDVRYQHTDNSAASMPTFVTKDGVTKDGVTQGNVTHPTTRWASTKNPLQLITTGWGLLTTPRRIALVSALTCIFAGLFLFLNVQGSWGYALNRRLWMLLTIGIVGVSAGVATVLFHTITHNRILTPAVMGFESLYLLIQTALVFSLGSDFNWFDSRVLRFSAEALMMLGFVMLLYRGLFHRNQDLHRLLLVGIVFGVLFASIANLLQRILEPAEFDVLQGRLFARLTLPDSSLVLICLALLTVLGVVVWRHRYLFDVLALGPTNATTLGVDQRRAVNLILLIVSVLVAISTALIGPLTFLGFLAATLAYQLLQTHQHRWLLPMAALLGCLFLLVGQVTLEHLLGMAGVLTVVIEFIGGALFLFILLRKGRL